MQKNRLAIFGGLPFINRNLAPYNSIGSEEKEAVAKVMETGCLSAFLAGDGEQSLGGAYVQRFERDICNFFGSEHAIAVNSWTSGLICMIGALEVEPGDEIIVPSWTMCATATAVLHWNLIPIFADIDPDTFCLDIESVRSVYTEKTRAILAADIFGHPASDPLLQAFCKEKNIALLFDSAQAPGAEMSGVFAGTSGDMGGFSFNYHKHIQTGEGGVVVTNNSGLAARVRLLRNHAEAGLSGGQKHELNNMIGYNFRMGELEAAIGSAQLKKLPAIIDDRIRAAERIKNGLQNLAGLKFPKSKKDVKNVFYVLGMKIDTELLQIDRNLLANALKAEGVPGLMSGYALVHQLPVFKHKIAYGRNGVPWTLTERNSEICYDDHNLPVSCRLHEKEFMGLEICLMALPDDDCDLIIGAFQKVWENLDQLKEKKNSVTFK